MPSGFALVGTEPCLAGKAKVAALLTKGIVSHATAATLHELGRWPIEPIHITTPQRRHENVPCLHEHRMVLLPEQIVEVDGVPVTDPLTTILDLISWLPERAARAFLFRSIQQKWLEPADFLNAIPDRSGRHGIQRLRSFADYLGTGAHSGGEMELHALLTRGGITFTANSKIRLPDGTLYELDALIDNSSIVIELDGRQFHADATTFQRDRVRQNALVNAGYVVLRFTVPDVIDRPAHVLSVITAAREQQNLRSGTARFWPPGDRKF